MEDLIAFLVFLFFIISRANKDRKRGMGEPTREVKQPEQGSIHIPRYIFAEKDEWEKPSAWTDTVKDEWGESSSWDETDQDHWDGEDSWGKAENTDRIETPFWVEAKVDQATNCVGENVDRSRELIFEKSDEEIIEGNIQGNSQGLDLRQAIIWSEILQKPRAMRRYGGRPGYRF